MDGIEKIIDRISSDAQREIDDVLAAAQAEAEKITAEYQAQAKAEADDILARGEKAAAERGERLASVDSWSAARKCCGPSRRSWKRPSSWP